MPRKLTGFERMWDAYPAPGRDPAAAKVVIGGAVDGDWLTNTCVVRVCRSMNYAGHPIPQGFPGLSTVPGADGMRYAYRLEEFRKYLIAEYGPPTFSEDRDPPRAEVPASFQGQRGIIAFRVRQWFDATGHIDLWDGERCAHAQYFANAYSVLLWTVAGDGEVNIASETLPSPLSGSVGQGGVNDPADVARVQALLAARGFDPGSPDGVIGPRTLAAISSFQKRFSGSADGRVDPDGRTWRELNGL